MEHKHKLAATLVLFEGLFISVYICGAKFIFKGQGTLFSTSMMMFFVSLCLFSASYPYGWLEAKAKQRKGTPLEKGKGSKKSKPSNGKQWCLFGLWSLCAIGGDIAFFFAMTYNAPLAESSIVTRGLTILLISLGTWRFFGQHTTKDQWIGISIGLAASASILFVVLGSKGSVFGGRHDYWGPAPAWLYFTAVLLITAPAKRLISRALNERLSISACLWGLNTVSIPLCLLIMALARAFSPETSAVMPSDFWKLLPLMLAAVLIGVICRYGAQALRLNPVYHDSLCYGIMLTAQFSYDLTQSLLDPEAVLSTLLLSAMLITVVLSAASSYLLYFSSNGSTKT